MATPKRARVRAPSRNTAAAPRANAARKRRRAPPQAAANPSKYLPVRRRYTDALLEHVRHRFEQTPEAVPSMAADLGIEPASLYRIARRYGWARRNPAPPARDVAPALTILEAARALAEGGDAGNAAAVSVDGAASLPPPERGRPPSGTRRVGVNEPMDVTPTRTASQSDLPLSGGGKPAAAPEPSTVERLERAVLAELATIEAMRAALGRMPQKPPGAQRTVRTLSMLTQTLQHLQRLRANEALSSKPAGPNDHDDNYDDDMPADIDEFRRDLARRIDAFVASRTDATGAHGNPGAEALGETR